MLANFPVTHHTLSIAVWSSTTYSWPRVYKVCILEWLRMVKISQSFRFLEMECNERLLHLLLNCAIGIFSIKCSTHDLRFAIFIENDLVLAPDFLWYFRITAPLLEHDPSIWCVSSWNDNGFSEIASDERKLFRTDYFPGLGWMIRNVTGMDTLLIPGVN